MRAPAALVLVFLLGLLLPVARSTVSAAAVCPPGSVRQGKRCVRCPSGFHYSRGHCVRYRCTAGCVYAGGGKCRCPRRR